MFSFNLFVIFVSTPIFGISATITENDYALMPSLFHYEDYDNCMLHDKNAVYCMVTIELHPNDPSNASEVWKIIQEINSSDNNYRHDLLRHGICMAETFTDQRDNLKNISQIREVLAHRYKKKYSNKGLTGEVAKIRCESKHSSHPIDNYDIIFGAFAVIYVTFVIVVTLYVKFENYSSKLKCQNISEKSSRDIISSFSLFHNWQRLLHVDFENKTIKTLRYIQGIRFYIMVIIIAVHTFGIFTTVPMSNPAYVEQRLYLLMKVAGNGQLLVQSFFVISAFLISFSFFTEFERSRYIKFSTLLSTFVNRYLRLIPSLAVVVAFQSTWIIHLSRGPFWEQLVAVEYRKCKENWWTNLLFINNCIHEYRMCLVQSWYLAADTQYLILGLIILWFAYKKPKIIYAASGGIIALQALYVFTITYWNQWGLYIRVTPEMVYGLHLSNSKELFTLHMSSYSNMSGYAMGLSLGHIFFKYRTKNPFTKTGSVVLCWIAVSSLTLGVILFPGLVELSGYYKHNALFSATYQSISRPLYSLGFGLALFALINGVGGILQWACELFPIYILGRLTYTAYLVQMIYPFFRAGSQKSPVYLSDGVMVMEIITDILVTYIGATILTLFIEMPMCRLGKQFLATELISKKESKRH